MFTLIFIVALNGLAERTILFDGFLTQSDCESAIKLVIEEIPAEQIYLLSCATPVGKSV